MHRPLRVVLLALPLAAAACSGPPAPDAALCRDVIHRLCLKPVCQRVTDRLQPGDACEETLLARTGCSDDAFEFSTPTRAQVIDCRNLLTRSGLDPEKAPACEDVENTLDQCGELTSFLEAKP